MQDSIRLACIAVAALVLTACASPQEINPAAPPKFDSTTTILLAPPDVELAELKASGLEETRADWTETGKRNVLAALRAENARRGVGFIELDYSNLTAEEQAEIAQISKLHRAVANSMMAHRHVEALRIPTKTSVYDWSLGPEVSVLRKANAGQGNYALFISLRDTHSSAGRVALQVFAAVFGVGVPGGSQIGYASLINLDTGQVAWFGSIAKPTGDLREAQSASATVNKLLKGLPG